MNALLLCLTSGVIGFVACVNVLAFGVVFRPWFRSRLIQLINSVERFPAIPPPVSPEAYEAISKILSAEAAK